MIELLAESAVRTLLVAMVAGLAVKAVRLRNPHLEMAVWQGVLAAGIAMPGLMQLPIRISLLPAPPAAASAGTGALPAPSMWDFHTLATSLYLVVAAAMLARLLLGTWAASRLVSRAEPAGGNVRISREITVPVTLGATILLPPDFSAWDAATRQAVLAHEGAHAARRDFYLLLAADIHKAVFWFNPLAWRLRARLAHLAEAACDDAAIGQMGDRPSYAGILLDFAGRANRTMAGVQMARRGGIADRVERILDETELTPPPSLRSKAFAALAVLPMLVMLGGLSVTAQAEAPAATGKMNITAEEAMDFAPDGKSLTARGQVKAALRDDLTLNAALLRADFADDPQGGSRVARIQISGGVAINSPNRSVQGDHADYSPDTGKITIDGKVSLIEGGKRLNGDHAVLYLAGDTVRVYPAAP